MNGVKYGAGDARMGELVSARRGTVDGDEVDLLVWIYPGRDPVRKSLPIVVHENI